MVIGPLNLKSGTVPEHSIGAQSARGQFAIAVCSKELGEAGDLVQLVQAQDTLCTETPKASTDHTQKVVCRNTFFSSFFKATWSSQICNVRDSACCQVHQGLHLLNLKRTVVSGKFLALGQLESFSQNNSSFSPS